MKQGNLRIQNSKKIKKVVSIILMMVFMLSILGVFGVNADTITGYTEYAREDFSGYTSDYVYQTNVSGQTFAGLSVISSSTQPNGASINAAGDYFEVNGKLGSRAYLTTTGFTFSGKSQVIIEFDFMQTEKGSATRILSTTNSTASVVGIILSSNGTALRSYDGDAQKTFMPSYNANQWYKFTVCVDTAANTYDVYVDGKCVISDWQMKLKSGMTSIGNLGRVFGVDISSGQPAVRYKNISIYADDREEIMSSAATALYTACPEGKTIAGQISLPTTSKNGYKLTWTSSDNTVINPETGIVSEVKSDKKVTLTATVEDNNGERSISRKFDVTVLGAELELESEGTKYIATVTNSVAEDPLVVVATYNGGQMIDFACGAVSGDKIVAEIDTSAYPTGDYGMQQQGQQKQISRK